MGPDTGSKHYRYCYSIELSRLGSRVPFITVPNMPVLRGGTTPNYPDSISLSVQQQ